MKEINLLSTCCNGIPIEDNKPSPKDHTDVEAIYRCPLCKNECEVDTVSNIIEAKRLNLRTRIVGEWDGEPVWRND